MGIESKILATTGIQHKAFSNKSKMLACFINTLKSPSRSIEFIQNRLRSATDIIKNGGHVTSLKRDQIFRMHFDNRRILE